MMFGYLTFHLLHEYHMNGFPVLLFGCSSQGFQALDLGAQGSMVIAGERYCR
jgi:hypothetical protein